MSRKNMTSFLVFLEIICCFSVFAQTLSIPASVDQAHTNLTLISDTQKISPGESFWVGARMRLDDGWHLYWKNPGDSGLAPAIQWNLPEGFSASPISWHFPVRINVGPLTSFGYEKEVVFWSQIFFSKNVSEIQSIQIDADVKWLACQVDCIPGRGQVSLFLPVTTGTVEKNPQGETILENSKRLWPVDSALWRIEAVDEGNALTLKIFSQREIRPTGEVIFFPEDTQLIDHPSAQKLVNESDGVQLTIKKSVLAAKPLERLKGVLVQDGGWDEGGVYRALNVDVPLFSQPLWLACGLAFLGGIILNFMPCVLPVLSLKLMGLLKSSGDRREIYLSGISFLFGVMVSFWVLAGLLIFLKSAGHQLGWGFQFQSSEFVVGMACLLFIFGLNLLGSFEIFLPASLSSMAFLRRRNSSVGPTQSHGVSGSFWSGVLATVLATPCTAPFMGTAIGFALSQPAWVAFLVFSFLGLGMASPYVLLCVFPRWIRGLPKPGPWMMTLKAVLGFLLLACVIWLVWVLGLQKGMSAVVILLGGLWLIGVGVWGLGNEQKTRGNLGKTVFVAVAILGGFLIPWFGVRFFPAVQETFGGEVVSSRTIPWKKFSIDSLNQSLKKQKPVFVDFTAAWCLTCQVNDRLVFQDKKVVETFQKFGIIPLQADWTNYDEEITRALAGYGKNSIPLYVFYDGVNSEPLVFPEIITPNAVIEIIQNKMVEKNTR